MTNWTGGGDFGGPNPIGGDPSGGQPGGGWGAPPPPPTQWTPEQPPPWGNPQQPGFPPPGPQQFGPAQPGWGGQWGQPPPPDGPKRNRKALLVTLGAGAAVLVVLVVVGVIALSSLGGSGDGGSSRSAGAAVQGYLEALARGDAEAALSYGAGEPASKELLTDEILKSQIEKMPISNIRILSDDSDNGVGFGKVHATVNFGDQVSDVTFLMKKSGNVWKLDSAAVRLDLSTQASSNRAMSTLTVFGKTVGDSVLYLFPGYIEWGTNNKNVTAQGQPLLLDALTGYAGGSAPKIVLSDSARKSITSAVRSYLDECARSKSLSPEGCPQRAFEYGAVDGTVTWHAPGTDNLQISFDGYSMEARVTLNGQFPYTVQGRDGAPINGSDHFMLYGRADLNQTPPVLKWN
ncbi:hypothetical protein [Mycolicibacterium thermoresistibile]